MDDEKGRVESLEEGLDEAGRAEERPVRVIVVVMVEGVLPCECVLGS